MTIRFYDRIDTVEEQEFVNFEPSPYVRSGDVDYIKNTAFMRFLSLGIDSTMPYFDRTNLAIAWCIENRELPELEWAFAHHFKGREWIFAAAARDPDGVVHAVRAPARHHHVMRATVKEREHLKHADLDQGFLAFKDGVTRYVDRKEAYQIAKGNGQLWRVVGPGNPYDGLELFSEDLW